ncbi:MAG: chitobiase/beta-hexosaminidase C-terminal domain-containing protein, partial [Spirochaetaceae bacterium]|nr:chitobiase/beta-hexosaminidase C-terminal domain-containing protein [Spirochaetaceae bacterium]
MKCKPSALGALFGVLLLPAQAGAQTPGAPVAGVINPRPGIWANEQTLALSVPEGCNVFYSFNGSDPMVSGFAYDGPVALSAQGTVTLRLATVGIDYSVKEESLTYTVRPAPPPESLARCFQAPLFAYSLDSDIAIPPDMLYCVGDDAVPRLPGRELSVSAVYPERLVPCTVTDGQNTWRFVINISRNAPFPPAPEGPPPRTPSMATAPFVIEHWSNLTFLPNYFIYSIDSGVWQRATGSTVIDRKTPHTIRWQSVDFTPGNPVYSYQIPAMPGIELAATVSGYALSPKIPPEVSAEAKKAGLSAESFDYTLSAAETGVASPLPWIPVDAFFGEEFSKTVLCRVFYKGEFQGLLNVTYKVDRNPPLAPVITANTRSFLSRDALSLTMEEPGGEPVFYAVRFTNPQEFTPFAARPDPAIYPPSPPPGAAYTRYDGNPVTLQAQGDSARAYSVYAYSEDGAGNRSAEVVLQAVVDPVNFYLSALQPPEAPAGDAPVGSFVSPFSRLEDALDAIRNRPNARLFVLGEFSLTTPVTLKRPCAFIGLEGARISLSGDAMFAVEDAAVSFRSIILEKTAPEEAAFLDPVFDVKNGILTFAGSSVTATDPGKGAVFALSGSTLVIESSLVSLGSGGY